MSIDAELLEAEVLRLIRERIINSSTVRIVEKVVKASQESAERNRPGHQEKTRKEIELVEKGIRSLLKVAENGIDLDEVTDRLRALQEKKVSLQSLLRDLNGEQPTNKVEGNVAERIAKFFSEFEQRFATAAPSEKKVILHQLVDKIVIDRDSKKAICYLRRLPKFESTVLDELIERAGTPLLIVPPTEQAQNECFLEEITECFEVSV